MGNKNTALLNQGNPNTNWNSAHSPQASLPLPSYVFSQHPMALHLPPPPMPVIHPVYPSNSNVPLVSNNGFYPQNQLQTNNGFYPQQQLHANSSFYQQNQLQSISPPFWLETFLKSYFFLCLLITFIIVLIIWKKNPVFIQREGEDPLIQQRASYAKLLFVGILLFLIFYLGPSLFQK